MDVPQLFLRCFIAVVVKVDQGENEAQGGGGGGVLRYNIDGEGDAKNFLRFEISDLRTF